MKRFCYAVLCSLGLCLVATMASQATPHLVVCVWCDVNGNGIIDPEIDFKYEGEEKIISLSPNIVDIPGRALKVIESFPSCYFVKTCFSDYQDCVDEFGEENCVRGSAQGFGIILPNLNETEPDNQFDYEVVIDLDCQVIYYQTIEYPLFKYITEQTGMFCKDIPKQYIYDNYPAVPSVDYPETVELTQNYEKNYIIDVLVERDCCNPQGGQGLTPGFWKNHDCTWEDTGYSQEQLFNDVFGVDCFEGTLLDALNANGGGVNAFARHAVAALLNSTQDAVSYDLTEIEVILAVQDCCDTEDYEFCKNIFEGFNEQENVDGGAICKDEKEQVFIINQSKNEKAKGKNK